MGNKSLAVKLSKCLLTKLSYCAEDEVVEMSQEDEPQSGVHSPTTTAFEKKLLRVDQVPLGKAPPSSPSGKSP